MGYAFLQGHLGSTSASTTGIAVCGSCGYMTIPVPVTPHAPAACVCRRVLDARVRSSRQAPVCPSLKKRGTVVKAAS